jgi:outer membrane protein assembly factor BamB
MMAEDRTFVFPVYFSPAAHVILNSASVDRALWSTRKRGIRVRAHATRTIHYVVLGLALMLVAATLSVLSISRASAASALVQDRNAMVSSGTTASLAFSKANTAGNLIVVYAVWDNPGSAQVSDTLGNTYTAATARQSWGAGGGWSAQVFYAPNVRAGANTVKATFGTAITSFGLLYIHEYSGLATASPVDVSASAAGTPAAMSSGAVTTTAASDLLFAAGASDVDVSHGTGFTARLTGFGNLTEDRAVTTTGSYAGTASQDGSTWVMQLVAFRVATGTLGPPARLGFVHGPSNTAAGAAVSPAVTVAVEDASGNVETGDNATTISLAIGTNPSGGTLTGGAAVTVVAGVATFAGLSINKTGTGYTLTASSTPSYTAATSAAFTITPGAAAKLAFVQGPSNAAAGAAISPAVTVAVQDANGNVETGDNATKVSLAIGTNPAGGTLSGGGAVTVAAGVATFAGLSVNTAGTGYTLTASSTPANTGATSAAFTITGVGAPAKLAFVQGPSSATTGSTITPAVTVAVEDASGNVETSDNATTISLAIGTNPAGGTLSGGAAVTVVAGVATFAGLSIDTAGTGYTLTASSTPANTAATSAAFNITSAPPPSGWTMFLGGIDHTGFAASETGFTPASAPSLHLKWKTTDAGPANRGVFSQPVVSNGLIYWGSFDGFERATDTSGNLVWQTNLGTTSPSTCTDPSEAGIASTPALTTDVPVGGATSVLYLGGGDSKVYALNAATGAVLWSYDVGGNPNTFVWSSPSVFGNSVYVGVASFGSCPDVQGRLLQLNRVTGALQNTFDTVPNGCIGGGVWSSPTIDAAAGTIYFTTGNQSGPGVGENPCPTAEMAPAIIEVRASDLSLLGSWTVPLNQQTCCGDGDWAATPTLFTGVIGGQSVPMVGSINKNGVFYAFQRDAISSGPVWQTRIATGGENPTTGTGDIAPAAWDGTKLYVGGDGTSSCAGTVNALNPSTGAFIWQHCFAEGPVLGAVTVTSGGVVAVGEGNAIQVVSAANGASLFTFTGTGPFWGGPSITGGTLYEGDMAGNLYALATSQTLSAQFVQVNSATPQSNQSTVTVPYTQAQSAGDLNVVAIGFFDATSTITSVTDSSGNVYQVAAPLKTGSGMSQAIYYAKNIKAATAGANTVTVTFSGAVAFPDVRVAEYAGIDPVAPLDTSASASGSGNTASSGNLTTSAANEVIFGAGYTTGLFGGGTNGFTSRIITSTDGDIAGDEFVGAAGTYAATATNSGGTWLMQAVAFHSA